MYRSEIHHPDLAAESAEWLLRLVDVYTALCIGWYENTVYFSLPTGLSRLDAGLLIQHIVPPKGKAAGHGTMAGGQVPTRKRFIIRNGVFFHGNIIQ